MTDHLPSKDLVSRLRIEHSHGLSDDAADEIERLQAEVANISEQYTNYHDWAQDEIKQARRTAEHWKAEHLAGNAELDRLQREIDQANDTIINGCLSRMKVTGECQPVFDRAGRCGTCTACGKNFTCGAALGERTTVEINAAVDERLDRVERELEEAWLPIETAPVQMEPILLTDGRWFAAGHVDPDGTRKFPIYHFAVCQEYDWTPTHWIPLPAGPAQPPGDVVHPEDIEGSQNSYTHPQSWDANGSPV